MNSGNRGFVLGIVAMFMFENENTGEHHIHSFANDRWEGIVVTMKGPLPEELIDDLNDWGWFIRAGNRRGAR